MDTHAPAPAYCLDHLSDDDLLASTRCQVGRANQVLAALLAHLAEVEARGIHRVRACSSLYTYCIYELRMSEDAALRRAHAAKIARQFPVLFEQIAAGEIHLTGVLMLGPHLTSANHLEVLARAKHRTKKEIASLVRMLDPLPDVPARIEPLGPRADGPVAPRNPSWAEFAASFCPAIRELEPGERPKDWIDTEGRDSLAVETAPEPRSGEIHAEAESDALGDTRPLPTLPPQRYKVQFTATQEYVNLLEQARDLLAHAVPDRALEEVHLRAMQLLVAELKKRKYAVNDESGSSCPTEDASEQTVEPLERDALRLASTRFDSLRDTRRGEIPDGVGGRYIPAAVRRAVWKRDEGRCSYVDATGQRCRETGCLELHHETAYARGGPPTESNISLRCRAHNALAAEDDFGRDFMAQKKPQPAPARV